MKKLDSAASVHVFNTKERFSNFRRASFWQGLLCGSNVIPIEGWGQISLPLKMRGRIKLLTLNHVAYISNFPLNLVSLGCLQKRGFDWSHRSGKISKKTARLLDIPDSAATAMKSAMTRKVQWPLPPSLRTWPPRKTLDPIKDRIPLHLQTLGTAEWAIPVH